MRESMKIPTMFLAVIAFFDSIYLTYHHYLINILRPVEKSFCAINSSVNCDTVALSEYAYMFGIPVSSLGIFAYSFLFVMLIIAMKSQSVQEKRKILSFLHLVMIVMLGFSLYEFYASIFFVESICIMCCVLYVAILFMTITTKIWLKISYAEIFRHAVSFFTELFTEKLSRAKLIVYTIVFASSLVLAFGMDRYFEHSFQAKKIKERELMFEKEKKELETEVLSSFEKAEVFDLDLSDSPMHGDENAKVVVVEISDFECPFCKRMGGILKDLEKELKGKFKLYFKHYPLDSSCNKTMSRQMHPYACAAAMHSYCAGKQSKFWQMHDYLFANVESFEESFFEAIEKNSGLELDPVSYRKCLAQDAPRKIAKELEELQKIEVNYTPMIFVNGKKFSDISADPKALKLIIEKLSEEGDAK